jgi:hypothetical protein
METGLVNMKRRWHWSLWAGLVLVLGAFVTMPFLARFPVTRPFAWLNMLLLFGGLAFLIFSLSKAFRQSALYRGKVLASVLTGVSLLLGALFVFGILYLGRVPLPTGMPGIGEKAPEFSLADQDGNTVTLRELLAKDSAGAGQAVRGALLIFYRGYW